MIECMRNAARKPQTNADRIRNMSDEELAEFMAYNAYCEECYVKKDDSLNGFNQKQNRREYGR